MPYSHAVHFILKTSNIWNIRFEFNGHNSHLLSNSQLEVCAAFATANFEHLHGIGCVTGYQVSQGIRIFTKPYLFEY